MEELEKWCRKHYKFIIENDPIDGITCVMLSAGGRIVDVCDYDLDKEEPTIDEVVREAVKRWHADTSIKKYRFLCDNKTEAEGVEWAERCKRWMGYGFAINEQEIKDKFNTNYVWEIRS